MKVTARQRVLSRTALIVLTLIWGYAFVVMKNTLNSIDTMELLSIRFLIACIVPVIISGRRILRLSRRAYIGAVLIGIATGFAYAVQNTGLKYTTPGKNAFLTAFYCIVTPFLCWAVYKKRPKPKNIIAAFICVIGMGFVSLTGIEGNINIGDILSIAGGVCFALQIIIIEEYSEDGDIFSVTAIQFFVAALTCIFLALVFKRPFTPVPRNAWPGILYLGFLSSTACNLLQLYGQKYTPSAQASVIMALEAVFASIFSLILGMESGSIIIYLGFALIFCSVLINELDITPDLKKKGNQHP